MSLDINAIKARLQSLDRKTEKSQKIKSNIWKPALGKQTIRILPYQYQPSNPFVELKFHYNFNKKSYLSPASFNKPDPIVELSEQLKKSGDKDQWKLGRSLEPKMRTYVPIIVRGEEEKGVKFWGFGQTVYKQLMAIISEPEYGDITDLNNGYDVQVEFKEVPGKSFPETVILVLPKPRPVIDPKSPKVKELLELITRKQPNILDVYDTATYEELHSALEEYLNKAKDNSETQASESTDDSAQAETTTATEETVKEELTPVTNFSMPEPPAEKVESNTPPQKPAAKPAVAVSGAKNTPNREDLQKAFDNLFNS